MATPLSSLNAVAPPLSKPLAPAASSHLEYLDGWRGVAIALVLAGHFYPTRYLYTAGVDFFFVLSGRLMAEILFEKRTDLRKFYIRRLSRILPALLVFVLLAALLFSHSQLRVGVLAIASALSFTLNYAMIYFHHTGLFDHLWSLCVQEHCYLLLGGLAFLCRNLKIGAANLLLPIGLLAMLNGVYQFSVLGYDGQDVFWRTDVALAPIFISAAFYLMFRRLPVAKYSWLPPTCLVAFLACKLEFVPTSISYNLGIILLATAVASLQCASARVHRLLSLAPLKQLGLWSYSIYLWQQPFYKLIGAAPTLLLLALALVCGLVSYYGIEEPSRTFLVGRLGQSRQRTLVRS